MNPVKVSIIIPVYCVEKYIERCALSLFNQTFDDIEFIFINDASTDKSIEILQSVIELYPNRNTKLINKRNNEGLPAARKTGVLESVGEYIVHVDSDDWVEPTFVEHMYQRCIEEDADMVYCNVLEEYDDHTEYIAQKTLDKEAYYRSCLRFISKFYVWNRMVKRDIYKDVDFPQYGMNEDYVLVTHLISKCKKVAHLDEYLHHYIRYNENSISYDIKRKRERIVEEILNIKLVYDRILHSDEAENYRFELDNQIVVILWLCLKNRLINAIGKSNLQSLIARFHEIEIHPKFNLSTHLQKLLKAIYCTSIYKIL